MNGLEEKPAPQPPEPPIIVCACRKFFRVHEMLRRRADFAPEWRTVAVILSAIVEKLKRRSKGDLKGRHFEAWLIIQAVTWYLRYPLSYRDLESMFLERGFEVDHSTINRWVLAYAPLVEKRLRQFRRPHCGSIRVDETYVKIRGEWRYLYRAIDKHGVPVDFLLTAKRDAAAAKRLFRKMLEDQPLLAPDKIGTEGASVYPATISDAVNAGLIPSGPLHRVSKHLQQGIESDHFHVKKNMPKVGGFRSFQTARKTIAGFEAMLWLKKGLTSPGSGPFANRTNCSPAVSDFKWLTKPEESLPRNLLLTFLEVCDTP
jgi:IS6 family transposase